MCKRIWRVARINLKNLKAPYITTGIIAAGFFAQIIVFVILFHKGMDTSDHGFISAGSALWLLPVLAGIIVPAKNFRRIVSLGGKRGNFFGGDS
jgi:hypothetical protein